MDKSWVHLHRSTQEYKDKMELFLNEALSKSARKDKIICPCKKCCNRYYEDKIIVGGHLLWHGMDPLYMTACWTHHGESYIDSTNARQIGPVDEIGSMDLIDSEGEAGQMYDFLNDTFVQPLIGDNVGSSRHKPVFEGRTPEAERFYKLLEDADKELYPGCKKYKKLEAVVKLYQIKCLGNVTNMAFSMFLEAFNDMLPDGACLPKSSYQAKKIIDDLGLKYEKIDACPNDCMLFWKDTSSLNVCSHCGASRYIVNKDGDSFGKQVSAKILRYFPLIPRLQRLYMSRYTAEYMRWHAIECPKDGFMRHPSDSPAWKHLDALYPDFESEIRNIRLGLASDGFNPFGNMSSSHSTWPVVISVYNLPPWMCMKQPNLFMSLLIPGPRGPGNDIDVYLRPLVDELIELWEVGVRTYDVFSNQTFNMKAALLWTINDFPAYANLSGWSTKGKLACPHCNHKTCSKRLSNSNKHCYLGHRRFLPIRHRFRTNATLFDGKRERDPAPISLTGIECLRQLSNLSFTFGKTPIVEPVIGQKRQRQRRSNDATREPRIGVKTPWKKKSIFFNLPYWQHLLIRHNLDVMHIEKNVSEKILGILLGTSTKMKDGIEARVELEQMKIRKALHPVREGVRTYLPPSIFFLTNEEKMLFCKVLSKVRVPDGYSTNLARCVNVNEKKIHGLKSHDHHVLMQQFLPLAIRRVLPKPITLVLLELSAIFRLLCRKKESETSFKQLKSRVVLALCQMEKMLPPSFFDVMVHLPIHLADEAAIAGPVQYRWMYPIERYLQTLKRYVRNKSCPEGSIAVGYLADEAVSFCSMYLNDVETRRTRRGRNADVSSTRDVLGGLPIFSHSGHSLGKCRKKDLQKSVWEQCHTYVLFNCSEVFPFLEKRLAELRKIHPRRTIREVENMRNKEFATWFKKHVNDLYAAGDSLISEDLCRLANGPNITVKQYKKYIINGSRFRIKSIDDKYKNQNCGVFVSAQTSSYSSLRDCNPITGNVDYFGVLKEIYELDYGFPGEPEDQAGKVVLFDCDWVNTSGKKIDQYGFTLVNFKRLAQNKDKFIVASQAIQVFYVADPIDTDWYVVVKTKPRDFFDVLEDGDGSPDQSHSLNLDDYYSTPNLDDPELDNEEIQIRTDVRGIYVNKRVPLPVENDSIVDEDDLSDDEDETENEIEDEID